MPTDTELVFLSLDRRVWPVTAKSAPKYLISTYQEAEKFCALILRAVRSNMRHHRLVKRKRLGLFWLAFQCIGSGMSPRVPFGMFRRRATVVVRFVAHDGLSDGIEQCLQAHFAHPLLISSRGRVLGRAMSCCMLRIKSRSPTFSGSSEQATGRRTL